MPKTMSDEAGFGLVIMSKLEEAENAVGQISIEDITRCIPEAARSINFETTGGRNQLVKKTREHLEGEKKNIKKKGDDLKKARRKLCKQRRKYKARKDIQWRCPRRVDLEQVHTTVYSLTDPVQSILVEPRVDEAARAGTRPRAQQNPGHCEMRLFRLSVQSCTPSWSCAVNLTGQTTDDSHSRGFHTTHSPWTPARQPPLRRFPTETLQDNCSAGSMQSTSFGFSGDAYYGPVFDQDPTTASGSAADTSSVRPSTRNHIELSLLRKTLEPSNVICQRECTL